MSINQLCVAIGISLDFADEIVKEYQIRHPYNLDDETIFKICFDKACEGNNTAKWFIRDLAVIGMSTSLPFIAQYYINS